MSWSGHLKEGWILSSVVYKRTCSGLCINIVYKVSFQEANTNFSTLAQGFRQMRTSGPLCTRELRQNGASRHSLDFTPAHDVSSFKAAPPTLPLELKGKHSRAACLSSSFSHPALLPFGPEPAVVVGVWSGHTLSHVLKRKIEGGGRPMQRSGSVRAAMAPSEDGGTCRSRTAGGEEAWAET